MDGKVGFPGNVSYKFGTGSFTLKLYTNFRDYFKHTKWPTGKDKAVFNSLGDQVSAFKKGGAAAIKNMYPQPIVEKTTPESGTLE